VTISSSSPDVYVYAGGTSLATPLIAGMMACLVQAHPEWSVSIMRARLIDKADYFGSPKPDPLFVYGYGIANALESLNSVGTWVDLENGLAGTSGIPALVGSGTLIEGDPISLSMTDARPNALSWLVVGMVTVNLPFYGGTLVPGFQAPEGLFVALPTTGTGTLDVGGTWPAAVPPGFSLYVQVWIDDPAAIFGVAGSNAVSGTTP
jgi:subtilisin family serine protease